MEFFIRFMTNYVVKFYILYFFLLSALYVWRDIGNACVLHGLTLNIEKHLKRVAKTLKFKY